MTYAQSTLAHPNGPLLGLTILWHPARARVGEQYIGPGEPGEIVLSRFQPMFQLQGGEGAPLAERCIGRTPLHLVRDGNDDLHIDVPESKMAVELNGRSISGTVRVARQQVDRGLVLCLGGQILLCVHWMHNLPKSSTPHALLGVSSAAIKLRELIGQVARTDLPVLLLGETGSGKEVAAKAIHHASQRASAPLVAVNMAALTEARAAVDLFGSAQGAYAADEAAHAGFFAEADGGTLFLDEIGGTPMAIQPMLLRVIESGEYRPLGAKKSLHSSARLIAASDQDLETRAFNQSLLRRLESFVIRVPSLRERREDIGLLTVHFLEQWERQSGSQCDLPLELVKAICLYEWPGNIRQLGNVVRRSAIGLQAGDKPVFEVLVRSPVSARSGVAAAPEDLPVLPAISAGAATALAELAGSDTRKVKLAEIGAQEVIDAMEHNAWQIQGAALELGISRPSLYKLLNSHPAIRRPEEIAPDEIRTALRINGADLAACASHLRTPSEALRRHLRSARLISG